MEHGALEATLLSSETAHRFYLSRDYRDSGPPQGKFGTTSPYPMTKELG